MATIGQISIHNNPKKFLEYILNPNKTRDDLISGINTIANVKIANNSFKKVFNQYYDNRYGEVDWNYTNTYDGKKHAVKVHHFYQSFDDESNITPELAHKIGEEWAKKCFGENAVVVIATHIDANHIHNHIGVASYTLDGKKIISDKSLDKVRKNISNDICREHGINPTVVEKAKENRKNGKKNTYIEDTYVRPRGTSWKAQIEKDIDEILPRVNTFEELLKQLEKKNYTVNTHGKYVKVKPQGKDRFVRLKSLSSGYDEQSLKNKILENLKSKVIVDVNFEVTATVTKKPLRQLLKEDIDNAINQSVSFEDFLRRMQVDYTIKQGVHIAFRKDGYGQSFLRSKSIGMDYDEEHIKERIEQNNLKRKSEVVQGMSKALDDNIVSLAGLEQKQFQLRTKIINLNKKIDDLSKQISQYDELMNVKDDYLKYVDLHLSKMTVMDTIQKQKIDLILMKNGIKNKSEFLAKLQELENSKHNYDLTIKEKNIASKEYQRYTKLINDYHKVQSQENIKKNNLKK